MPTKTRSLLWQFRRSCLRMLWILIVPGLPGVIGSTSAQTAPKPEAVAHPALGINLSGAVDWSTELPFVDVFRLSRAWISQRQGAGWGQGPELQLDDRGWIQKLEPDCFAETPLCTIEGGHYPSGVWNVYWDGDGDVELSKGRVQMSRPGHLQVDIHSAGGGFFLRIRRTATENPVRNIQVLMPGFSPDDVRQNPWHPGFLARWQGMACLRFMDLQDTNNSEQQRWTDRPRPDDATWTRRGLPVEVLCDLARRLHADAWFCLPHQADDDYVRQFATVVRDQLPADRRAWIEYSNEVWNGQFRQHQYAAAQGQRQGLADKPWEAAWRYTAIRSCEIFGIWEEVFRGRDRLVRVLPSQAANSYVAEQILGWKNAGDQADVLAIAPYISMNIPESGENHKAAEVATWTTDRFLDEVEQQALPECTDWMQKNADVAKLRCSPDPGPPDMLRKRGSNGGARSVQRV